MRVKKPNSTEMDLFHASEVLAAIRQYRARTSATYQEAQLAFNLRATAGIPEDMVHTAGSKRPLIRHVRRLTADQLISEISESLAESDGEHLAKLANQVLSNHVNYNPKSVDLRTPFSIITYESKPPKKTKTPNGVCPACGWGECSCIPVGDPQDQAKDD